jgi:tetratricopeptide (TPR) repeat protein
MRGKLILAAALLLTRISSSASGLGASYGAEFLGLGGGARPLAMGEAYAAAADDVSSIIYNPAGLAYLNRPQFLAMYNSYFAGVSQRLVLAAFPTRFGRFGIGYTDLASGDIPGYDAGGTPTEPFSASSNSVSLSYANKLRENLFFGFSVKGISEKLEKITASTYAFDAGVQWAMNQHLKFGAAASNMGPGLSFVDENTPLPVSWRAGAAFTTGAVGRRLTLASDAVAYQDLIQTNLGIEYSPHEILVLRAGYKGGQARMGMGLFFKNFSFDYAYSPHQYLGASHQFSIGLEAGGEDRIQKSVMELLALADAHFENGAYPDAILTYTRILDIDPGNGRAAEGLRKSRGELDSRAYLSVVQAGREDSKTSADDLISLSESLIGSGRYADALVALSQALREDPSSRRALDLLKTAQSKISERIETGRKLEERESMGHAIKLVTMGQHDEAGKILKDILAANPGNEQAQELMRKLEVIKELEKTKGAGQ